MNTTTADANPQAMEQSRPHPLRRPVHDRMLAGVAAGIADYLGADVTIIRIVLAVLAFVGGAGVPIYLACWLLIPEEGSDQSIASGFFQSRQTRSL
jgi:phage shock protein PspC (stress-responsive transcriptional regulator)